MTPSVPTQSNSRRLAKTNGAIQGLLLAPSLVLTLVGVAVLPVPDYALFALLFALGSGAIVIDGGSFHLAQIYRAQGKLSRMELGSLLVRASVVPVVLTLATVAGVAHLQDWLGVAPTDAQWLLPLLVGAGTITRTGQNVLNGVVLGAREQRPRLTAASLSAGAQLLICGYAIVEPSAVALATAYLVGASVGLVALLPAVARSIGTPPARGRDAVPTRTILAAGGIAISQLDRILAGVAAGPVGLASYDLASRLILTAKTGCALLASGLVAEGSRHTSQNALPLADFLRGRGSIQHLMDKLVFIVFLLAPASVGLFALVLSPELLDVALPVAAILALGHGIHVTTAPVTALFSGARVLRLEMVQSGTILFLFGVLVVPLTVAFGPIGTASAVAVALSLPSIWLRRRAISLAAALPRDRDSVDGRPDAPEPPLASTDRRAARA